MKNILIALFIMCLSVSMAVASSYFKSDIVQVWNKSGTDEYKAKIYCTFTTVDPLSYNRIADNLNNLIGVKKTGDDCSWSVSSVQYVPQMNQLSILVEVYFSQSSENTMGLPVDDTGRLNDKYYTSSEIQKLVTWKLKYLTTEVVSALQVLLNDVDGEWVPYPIYGRPSYVVKPGK